MMWRIGLAIVVGAVLLPIVVVVGHVFVPTGDLWDHLAATVLPRYVVNTLWLLVGVGVLTLVGGVGAAWLVSLCRFPGRRFFSWALLLPFAASASRLSIRKAALFMLLAIFQVPVPIAPLFW